ncbi:Cytochrome P450, partial [Dillenia turbinata]
MEWSVLLSFYACTGVVSWLLILSFLRYLFCKLCLKPAGVPWELEKQHIRGPLPSFILGNIPEMEWIQSMAVKSLNSCKHFDPLPALDYSQTLFPYFKHWTNQYGKTFFFRLGSVKLLYVADPHLVKEVNICKSLDLGKPVYLQKDRGPLLGKGLITTSGAVWSHQRRTITPQLYMDKVKDIFNVIVESAGKLVKTWESMIESEGGIADVRVDDYVRSYTTEIISKMMFGSDYGKGVEMRHKCKALIDAMAQPTILSGLPFARLISSHQKEYGGLKLEKDIYSMIIDIARKHGQAKSGDLIDILKDGSKHGELGPSTPDQFIVDNCKDVYLAAFEVTGIAAIWGLMLLAAHPEWQARARSEVLEVCGGHPLDANVLSKMKMRMVIQEVLRLYPGVAFASRQALEDVRIGKLLVPKGVCIWLWMPALHRDPELWGPDADKFDPGRFANGVSGACKSPQAYIPFGVGNPVCPGQYLAFTEMKVLFALVLSNFSLSLSPEYHHSPRL